MYYRASHRGVQGEWMRTKEGALVDLVRVLVATRNTDALCELIPVTMR